MKTKFHTFLSHNSADKPAVERVARMLRAEGLDPWLDKWNLIPGNPWQDEIEQALQDCETCCVFIGPCGLGPWQHAEMRSAINRRITKGDFRVIPVLLPGSRRDQRSEYPGFLTQTTWVEFRNTLDDHDAFQRLIAGIRGVAPGPISEYVPESDICPYRGLEVFKAEHEQFFFGREALTEWIVEALRAQLRKTHGTRFLAVIGASGSGKSSLVRAGLIPALHRGVIPHSEKWPILTFKPGPDPVESLAISLKQNQLAGQYLDDIGTVKRLLTEGDKGLHVQCRLAIEERREELRFVVVVDQFEEVFTLCKDEQLRETFLRNLLYAASEAAGRVVIVITMRADFYGFCAHYDDLAKVLSDHQILIGSMSDSELRDAIVKPAQVSGCELEQGLVEILIQDFKGQPGALPLLQYALTQLWRMRAGRRMTIDSYNSFGQIEGAIDRRANEIYDQFAPLEQDLCKRIFLRLTQPGEGTEDTKRRAYRSEFGQGPHVEDIIKALTDERLITVEGAIENAESFMEVSHEALIRSWSRLSKWIDESREDLRIQTRLTEAAYEWDRNRATNSDDFVFRGARLLEVEEWAEKEHANLNELEQEFLSLSIRARDSRIETEKKRRHRFLVLLVSSVLILGGIIGFAVTQYREKQRANLQIAQIQQAKEQEAARSDIRGSFTAFSTTYGGEAYEVEGRGAFTLSLERQLFKEYTSLSKAVSQAQLELQYRQRAETISSLNGEIYLRPRNENRRFYALIVGINEYENGWPKLQGATADAKSMHEALVQEGYDSTILIDANFDELNSALSRLLLRAKEDCPFADPKTENQSGLRGIVPIQELRPCENTALFVYFSGHGFVRNGVSHVVPVDGVYPVGESAGEVPKSINIDYLRGQMAEAVDVQIIIADVSRSVLTVER